MKYLGYACAIALGVTWVELGYGITTWEYWLMLAFFFGSTVTSYYRGIRYGRGER